MSLLSSTRFFAEKLQQFRLRKFLRVERRKGKLCCIFINNVISRSIFFKIFLIKVFNLHYNLFTPKLRFIYSVKRLFAYCFDKAPTLYLGFYINGPPKIILIEIKPIEKLTQVLKDTTLAILCCVYNLKGGAIC